MRAEDIKVGQNFYFNGVLHRVEDVGKLKLIEVNSEIIVTLSYYNRVYRRVTRKMSMNKLLEYIAYEETPSGKFWSKFNANLF